MAVEEEGEGEVVRLINSTNELMIFTSDFYNVQMKCLKLVNQWLKYYYWPRLINIMPVFIDYGQSD
jgi:hypothetical protein